MAVGRAVRADGPEILKHSLHPMPACIDASARAPSFLLAALHARYDRQDDRGGERCDGADAGSAPHLQAVPFEPRPPVVRVVDVVDLRGVGRRRGRRAASGGAAANSSGARQRRRPRRRRRRRAAAAHRGEVLPVVVGPAHPPVELGRRVAFALAVRAHRDVVRRERRLGRAEFSKRRQRPWSEGRRGIFDGGGGVCRSARSSSVSSVAYSAGSMAANCPQRGKNRVAPKAE